MERGEAVGVGSGGELELREVEEFLEVGAEEGVVGRRRRRRWVVGLGRSVGGGGGGEREPPLCEALRGCGRGRG